METMTVDKLEWKYAKTHPNHHFFDRETMKFFGERWSDMRVFKKTEIVVDRKGNEHECYVLSSLQRNAPGGAKRAYHYFDVDTFDVIMPPK